jgi:hypothetical protein
MPSRSSRISALRHIRTDTEAPSVKKMACVHTTDTISINCSDTTSSTAGRAYIGVGLDTIAFGDEVCDVLADHRVSPRVAVSTNTTLEGTEHPLGARNGILGEELADAGILQQERRGNQRQHLQRESRHGYKPCSL